MLHSVGSSNPLLFVCFSEHLVVNTAAGPLEFAVVNEPVKFPEDVDCLDHAIGSDGLGARPIRRWICHITELLNHHGIEGRESVLSRSKDLSIGWAKHANTLKSYRSLWLPAAHWLHIDSFGMACAFITVCCIREDCTRLRMFVTMEDNPRSGWLTSGKHPDFVTRDQMRHLAMHYSEQSGKFRKISKSMVLNNSVGGWRQTTDPHGDMIVSDRLYLDIRWSYNGQL